MNHKRRRSKNQRAGCLLCKPWKMNGVSENNKGYANPTNFKKLEDAREQIDAVSRGISGEDK